MNGNPDLVLHYDKSTMRPARPETADGHAKVWLRMLNGADDIAISEAMYSFDDSGRVHLNKTASDVQHVCRAVGRIDDLYLPTGEHIGSPLTEAVYRTLPRWMVVKIRLAVNDEELALSTDGALPESDAPSASC